MSLTGWRHKGRSDGSAGWRHGLRGGWLRGQDLNLRPSGYEPDELPGCSTPRHHLYASIAGASIRSLGFPRISSGGRSALRSLSAPKTRRQSEWVLSIPRTPPAKPGDDLLFQRLSGSTIGAARFHGRVRDGIGWVTGAMVTKLWRRRAKDLEIDVLSAEPGQRRGSDTNPILTMTVGLSSANRAIRTG